MTYPSDAIAQTERALLGSVLLDNSVWSQTNELTVQDFSLDTHRRIYERMAAMFEDQQPVDLVTLAGELGDNDVAYLSGLIDHALPENFSAYVRSVRQASRERRFERLLEQLTKADDSELRLSLLQQIQETLTESTEGHIRTLEDIPDPFSLPGHDTEWAVAGLIPKGAVTLIIGDPGCGKTWLALNLGNSVSAGGEFLDREAMRMPVLYLDRENPLSLIRERLSIICGGPGVFNPWGTWCKDEPPMLGDPRLLKFAKQGCLIIFDSLIRFHDKDENSASEMRVVMGHLRRLAAVGATVVALHHRGKSEASNYRGSTDILGAVDVGFKLSRTDDGLLELTTVGVKNRVGPDIQMTIRPDFATGQFSVVEAPALVTTRHEMEMLGNVIRENPGLSANKIIERSGMSRQRVFGLLQRGNGSAWKRENGPQKSHLYYPI